MKVIATDLDRTLVPNGNHRLTNGAMECFRYLVKKNKISLIYVTGRGKRLLLDAINHYSLPKPEYCISLVGVIVYKYVNGKLKEDLSWQSRLRRSCSGCIASEIKLALSDIKELWQQPSNLLHKFKQSYYIKLSDNKDRVIKKIRSRLDKHNINATIIYSIDTRRKIGLIDIIPPNASKVNALNYVLRKLKVKKNDVLYCGDSGNDISVLTSGYRSVLVKNAAFSVKDEVLRLAEQKRLLNRVYLAQGNFVEPSKRLKLNGNYVSGIIEGAYHFGFFK